MTDLLTREQIEAALERAKQAETVEALVAVSERDVPALARDLLAARERIEELERVVERLLSVTTDDCESLSQCRACGLREPNPATKYRGCEAGLAAIAALAHLDAGEEGRLCRET